MGGGNPAVYGGRLCDCLYLPVGIARSVGCACLLVDTDDIVHGGVGVFAGTAYKYNSDDNTVFCVAVGILPNSRCVPCPRSKKSPGKRQHTPPSVRIIQKKIKKEVQERNVLALPFLCVVYSITIAILTPVKEMFFSIASTYCSSG